MKVTVCTMNYNLGNFIGETIKSVLAQTFTDFEYIIIDDASTDDSLDVIDSFDDPRIRVIPLRENSGNPDILANMALEQAKGDYFTIIPSDDVWEPQYLEKTVGKLDADPVFGSVITHLSLIDEDSKLYGKPHPCDTILEEPNRGQGEWLQLLYAGNRIRGGFIFRRSLNIGEFDTSLAQLADLDFYIRAIKAAPIFVVREKLMKIRVRGNENRCAETSKNIEAHIKNLGIIQRRYYRTPVNRSAPKLIIATPFYEAKGFSPYIDSIVKTGRLLDKMGIDWEFMSLSGDSYVDRARNTICAKFLESDATHLLLIDSDESWDENAIPKMLACDKEVIGGAYPQKNNWDTWSSIPYTPDNKIIGESCNGEHIIEAQCVSAGFMMVKREILEEFEKYYPQMCYTDTSASPERPMRMYISFFECFRSGGRRYGEDYTFCNRVRDMGKKIWIYPYISFGHYGIHGWYGNYAESLCKNPVTECDRYGRVL